MAVYVDSNHLTHQYDSVTAPAALDNIIDTSKPGCQYCHVGAYLYKSMGDYNNQVPYGNHVRNFIEPGMGAHYYLQTGYSTTYCKATMRVNLREVSCNPKGKRHGFICLGMITDGWKLKQCDLGLTYDSPASGSGEGWYPFVWSRNYSTGGENLPIDPNDPTKTDKQHRFLGGGGTNPIKLPSDALIEVEIRVYRDTQNDHVDGKVCIIGQNNRVVEEFPITFAASKGNFFETQSSDPRLRFERFMSLVPEGGPANDNMDNSTMTGIIRDCTLYASSGAAYRWNASRTAYAWSVQGANILDLQLGGLTDGSLADNADKCVIHHRYGLH